MVGGEGCNSSIVGAVADYVERSHKSKTYGRQDIKSKCSSVSLINALKSERNVLFVVAFPRHIFL